MPLNLLLDYDYYLSNQLLPPIERLCEPIEGTDRSRLAECLGMCLTLCKNLKLESFLGLDPTRFRTSSGPDEHTFSALDAQISDAEKFRDATPFRVRCRHCQGQLAFSLSELEVSPYYMCTESTLMFSPKTSILHITGPACPVCSKSISPGSLQTQLEVQIREHIARYYEGWTVCDDPTCNYSTRMMGVYGRRCLRSGCRGRVAFKVTQLQSYAFRNYHWPKYQYSDTQLYNQLLYFMSLFDGSKALSTIKDSESHSVYNPYSRTHQVSL